MAKCVIGSRTLLAVLKAVPPQERERSLDRLSFDDPGALLIDKGVDDPGALLIDKGETLDNETALFSAFVPLSTIHWCRKQWDIGRPLRSRLPRPL